MEQTLTYVPRSAAESEHNVRSQAVRSDDARLFAEFLSGNDTSFEVFFERHSERLYLYCARLLGSGEQAHDIVGSMWEQVIGIRGSDKTIDNPLGFCLTIARNLCFNHMKRRKRQMPFDERARAQFDAAGAESSGGRSELEDMVLEELARLPMKFREVLVLNVYSEYSFDEIGEMLDISVAAAWKRASRGRKHLRDAVLKRMESDA